MKAPSQKCSEDYRSCRFIDERGGVRCVHANAGAVRQEQQAGYVWSVGSTRTKVEA